MMKEDVLKMDMVKAAEDLVIEIRKVFKEKNFSKAVLGVSGGIDSAVVAFLLAKAIGANNVIGVMLPYGGQSTVHAEEVIKAAGIRSEFFDITPMVDAYFSRQSGADRVRKGNKMARERMSVLYDRSQVHRALVVGTGNRTEIELGYFTLHGDGASALAPLASLFKTQVFRMAEHLGVPSAIIDKKPSADLWEGQTDEDEIGATYAEMDKVLYYIGLGRSPEDIVNTGMDRTVVELVVRRVIANRYKTEGPVFL